MSYPKYLTEERKNDADLYLQLDIVEKYLPKLLIKYKNYKKEKRVSEGSIIDWISL